MLLSIPTCSSLVNVFFSYVVFSVNVIVFSVIVVFSVNVIATCISRPPSKNCQGLKLIEGN